MSEIFEGLSKSQRDAVECLEGPVLIVAGAGSGKTRVLTGRVAHVLESGYEPHRILALTFTRKAAGEMKSRIAEMVGRRKAWGLCMGTFHSVFIRFLRDYADVLGYPKNFTIYDTGDSISALKTCIRELGLDDKVYNPKKVLGRISIAKNNLVTAEKYKQDKELLFGDQRRKMPKIAQIYEKYQEKLRMFGVMDFDDILLNTNMLVYNHPEIGDEIAGRFDFIMVDEYQDTNMTQYFIIRRLAKDHRNICVVGDDSQSIYAFRGARIENILNFKKDYPECKVFRLEQNYRSTQNIVEAANSLIRKNEDRIKKKCFSEAEPGEKIKLIRAYTEAEESLLVARSILARKHADKDVKYGDFAVLYRTNAQSRSLERDFMKRNIPYVIYSGFSFFDRAEVKDMMAYFKLAVNLNDDESFRRIYNKPARGIGLNTFNALYTVSLRVKKSLFETIGCEELEHSGMRSSAIKRLRAFRDMILRAHNKLSEKNAYEIALQLADESGLYAFYKRDDSFESRSGAENIEELISSVKEFVDEKDYEHREDLMEDLEVSDVSEIDEADVPVFTLGDYLEDSSLMSDADVDDKDSDDKVKLMTVHSAKGLEFPYVFIVGMEENVFPGSMSLNTSRGIQEERRLFYVALTRARKAVTLCFAKSRMKYGKTMFNKPSRFIGEIDINCIDNPELLVNEKENETPKTSNSFGGTINKVTVGSYSGTGVVPSRFKPISHLKAKAKATGIGLTVNDPESVMEIREGQRIEHNRFGYGRVMELSGNEDNRKAKINFDNYGEKILLLKYAKIRVHSK